MKAKGTETITPLDKRRRKGKVLQSPFSEMSAAPKTVNSSWLNDHLLNVLWACILTGSLKRKHYLELFRKVALAGKNALEGPKHQSVCHNYLSTLDQSAFNRVFGPISADKVARSALKCITIIDSLPDIDLWRKLLGDPADSEDLWLLLGRGVAACMSHQSQEATDVRWLKLLFLIVCERINVSPDQEREIRQYPHRGDMRRVRPTIRAAEVAFRPLESSPEQPDCVPDFDSEEIWLELFQKTKCTFAPQAEPTAANLADLSTELEEILIELRNHFMGSITSTSVDAKLDSAFGLALYSLSLTYELVHAGSRVLPTGRILLRTVAECFITLAFLRKKDESEVWQQYRNYGAGQTALAFLKTSKSDDTPDYINLKRLKMLADEDAWMEMQDIKIGSWADKNLRKMSEEAGVKDVYDDYYDWPSGFVHGQWGSVRDAVFTTCMNPLHRLHRIPMPMRLMPSVLVDCCKLVNRILDELSALYPGLDSRINWHKGEAHSSDRKISPK